MKRARRAAALVAAALAAAAAGCAPTVRAGDYFAAPLQQPATARARLSARWRVQPAPSGCATVGAPIVFLPALGLTQHSWTGVTAALAACRPRVLVDLPGVGEAPITGAFSAEEVLAALDDVVDAVAPDGRIVLAGHSLGGALAARMAARLGARVEALVLVAAPLSSIPLNRWEHLLLLPSLWPPFLHVAGAWAGVRLGLERVEEGGQRISALDIALIAAEWSDHQRRGASREYYRRVPRRARAPAQRRGVRARDRAAAVRVGQPTTASSPTPSCPTAPASSCASPAPGTSWRRRSRARSPLRSIASWRRARRRQRRPPARACSCRATVRAALASASGRRGASSFRSSVPARCSRRAGRAADAPISRCTSGSRAAASIRTFPSRQDAWRCSSAPRSAAMRPAGSSPICRRPGRFELVWRWGGGYHVDGSLLVDPRNGQVGGYGALGYSPSVIPWLRAFVGGGALPGDSARLLIGIDVTARVTGLLF